MKKNSFVAAGALFEVDLHGFHKQKCEIERIVSGDSKGGGCAMREFVVNEKENV